MKGLPCPCPVLPHCWLLGSCLMAEGSRTPALGAGPPLSIQLLRAQYEGQRQQQRAQAHVVMLRTGGSMPAPADVVLNAVWINKERRPSLAPGEAAPEVGKGHDVADGGRLQPPESPWHTHLEMHRLGQTSHQEISGQAKHKGNVTGSEQSPRQDGDPGWSANCQGPRRGSRVPEAAQSACEMTGVQTRAAAGSALNRAAQCSPGESPPRSRRPAHYPFPQRKNPRISQAARNLGLYGPV
ncbi:uncharacterized protein C9orf152 homolog [Erinaceus europaeus]|uniref:Uncharacterized protein C9orf152 homolog n=1 Tax=Erinaceus europaeus TaxID=9365 RepID=A0A1S3ALR0_ERIEU|nr:uncharacterized protein C9orf152 homolog [Erinaceus europaeus]